MAGKIFTLWGSVRADDKDLKKDLKSIEQQIGAASHKMRTSVDTAAKKMGKALGYALVAASAVAVYEIQKIGREAIKAASDLEETTGKFNVVFKGQEEVAKQWSKTLVDSYAMSTEESKRFLSSIQDLLVPMGMNAEEAGKMSFEVTKLAADLGSFNNLPTAQVMLDIQSALVGNFETMKKYGVVLNETVVKQAALNMGLWDGKGMVDANIKAQVAYALMLKGSAAAIGDQARTMDSYANQVKSLTASYTDLLAKIGDEFLPIATQVVSIMNVWIKANTDLIASNVGDVVSQWAAGLAGLLEVFQSVVKGIGFMAQSWDALTVAGNSAIFAIVSGMEFVIIAIRAVFKPLEVLGHAFELLGILDYNPVREAINEVNKVVLNLGVTTRQVLDDSIDKLIQTTAKYKGYDDSIQKVIDSIKEIKPAMEDLDSQVLDDLGKSFEAIAEKVTKTVIVLDEVKTALTGIQSYKSVQIEVDVTDKASPVLGKIKGDIGAITGKAVQTFSTGSVGPAGGMDEATLTATSTMMDSPSKGGHKAKIDVIGDAKAKTTEIKAKIDAVKEPVQIPIVVNAADGIKKLTTVDRYHNSLDGKHTYSTHTVTTEFKGKGSTEKSLSEKVIEVINWLSQIQNKAAEPLTMTLDVSPIHATFAQLDRSIEEARRKFAVKQVWGPDFIWPWDMRHPDYKSWTMLMKMNVRLPTGGRGEWGELYTPLVKDEYTRQAGGYIPGYGGGDTVDLKAERGEYIINKDSVRKFGVGFFDNLNSKKGALTKSSGGATTVKKESSTRGGATYNITIAPQFMTGDKAAARQVAIDINRELTALNGRWG